MAATAIAPPNSTNVSTIERQLARMREDAEREEARLQRDIVRAQRLRDINTPVPDVVNYMRTVPLEEWRRLMENRTIHKNWFMIAVGVHLEQARPNGWSLDDFTAVATAILGKINIWTHGINTDNHDDKASIRSSVYEMSPSSCQHWFKYGIRHSSGLNNPICFVNRELANLNSDHEWQKVNGVGTGRNITQVRNNWHFVPNLDKDHWNNILYGPLPSVQILEQAQVTRTVGDRAS